MKRLPLASTLKQSGGIDRVVRGERLEQGSSLQEHGVGSREWVVTPTRPIGPSLLGLEDGSVG